MSTQNTHTHTHTHTHMLDKQSFGTQGSLIPHGHTPASGKLRDWRRQPDQVERRLVLSNRLIAMSGVLGIICSMLQHEMIVAKFPPTHVSMNILKGVNSGFSAICVMLLIGHYRLIILMERINNHLNLDVALDASVRMPDLLAKKPLWLEVRHVCDI